MRLKPVESKLKLAKVQSPCKFGKLELKKVAPFKPKWLAQNEAKQSLKMLAANLQVLIMT